MSVFLACFNITISLPELHCFNVPLERLTNLELNLRKTTRTNIYLRIQFAEWYSRSFSSKQFFLSDQSLSHVFRSVHARSSLHASVRNRGNGTIIGHSLVDLSNRRKFSKTAMIRRSAGYYDKRDLVPVLPSVSVILHHLWTIPPVKNQSQNKFTTTLHRWSTYFEPYVSPCSS